MILQENTVWLSSSPTDMRKSIDGLSVLVVEEFDLNPTAAGIFVFWNRNKDKLKVLYWHINGFCMLYKRLEKQRLKLPEDLEQPLQMTTKELRWLLEGLDLNKINGYKKIKYKCFH